MERSSSIVIDGLWKRYRIGASALSLRETLSRVFHRSRNGQDSDTDFWALKDINLEVQTGEALGIIGRNGAGKSTLLKVLSRISEPTRGRIEIQGRVSSLLEVGTGFHPELTGRENIFLNGTLLGMRRHEVKSKLDQIVDFSGVEKFISTPIKFYSSGMKVRLAFSVAAHLQPEVMLIDEVLAVGDAEFQRKCLGKMEETASSGRTVLFVSHNMVAVERLCSRGLLIDNGEGRVYTDVRTMIDDYLATSHTFEPTRDQNSGAQIELLQVITHDQNLSPRESFNVDQRVGLSFKYRLKQSGLKFRHAINLHNDQGVNVLTSIDLKTQANEGNGEYTATVWVPENLLNEGTYFFSVACIVPSPYMAFFHEQQVVRFRVGDNGQGVSSRGDYTGNFPGVIRPMLDWDLKKNSD